MHLGKLKNESFIKDYKLEFSTVTQLVDVACTELKKRKLAKEKRAKWREEALTEYAKSKPKHAWENIDEEDFA